MKLKKFDIKEDLTGQFSILMIASRASGKTVCLKEMTIKRGGIMSKVDVIYVFCKTHNTRYYLGYIPKDNIFDGGLEEMKVILPKIIRKNLEIEEKTGKQLNIAIYVDDLLGSGKAKRNSFLDEQYSTIRHGLGKHGGIVLLIQRVSWCKSLLTNCSHVIFLPRNGIKMYGDKKIICEDFLQNWGTKEEIYELWGKFKKYECLVVCCFKDKNNLKWYKADHRIAKYRIDWEEEKEKVQTYGRGRKMEEIEYSSDSESE